MQKQIQKDMVQAMKERNEIKKETLRLVLSEIKNEQIKQRKELGDEDVTKILKRGIKTRQEALALFQQGNRGDLVDKTKIEIKVIESYLPKQLSKEQLENIVAEIIKETGAETAKDAGRVMKAVMEKYGSQADGKTVQQIVSSKLANPRPDGVGL